MCPRTSCRLPADHEGGSQVVANVVMAISSLPPQCPCASGVISALTIEIALLQCPGPSPESLMPVDQPIGLDQERMPSSTGQGGYIKNQHHGMISPECAGSSTLIAKFGTR